MSTIAAASAASGVAAASSSSTSTLTSSDNNNRQKNNGTTTSTTQPRGGGGDSGYEELQKLIKMGLQRARQALDTQILIDATYDSGNFGIDVGSSNNNDDDDDANETNNYLTTVMNDMLDKINTSVFEDMKQVDNNNNKDNNGGNTASKQQQQQFNVILAKVRDRLNWFDNCTQRIIQEEQQQKLQERNDKTSASTAIKSTLLPNGITMEDVMRHKQYQELLQQKHDLQKQIEESKENIVQLSNEQSSKTQIVKKNLQQIQSISKKLSVTAEYTSCSATTTTTVTAAAAVYNNNTDAMMMEVDDDDVAMKNAPEEEEDSNNNDDVEEDVVVANQNDNNNKDIDESNDSYVPSSSTTKTETALPS